MSEGFNIVVALAKKVLKENGDYVFSSGGERGEGDELVSNYFLVHGVFSGYDDRHMEVVRRIDGERISVERRRILRLNATDGIIRMQCERDLMDVDRVFTKGSERYRELSQRLENAQYGEEGFRNSGKNGKVEVAKVG